jgi:hypothetical protein
MHYSWMAPCRIALAGRLGRDFRELTLEFGQFAGGNTPILLTQRKKLKSTGGF